MIRRRYRVERVLGRGGMGEVLLAHDTLLHRRVALKRLRSDDDADGGPRGSILREARRASQVSAPGIAAIYDVLEEQNDVLIVMEYVEGETLRSRTTTPMSVPEFRDIAHQSLAGVGAAHTRGIVHRDLKPENLMRTPEGRIKILDFGIARRSDAPEGTAPSLSTTTLTAEAEGVIAGTPQYMAPEAHYGGRIDRRTDLFSLGTVFYELLTATNPFRAPTFHDIRERVMTHVPRPASELNVEVNPALATVLARMMAKDPAQRQASCEEVQREIDAAIDGTGRIEASASSTPAVRAPGARRARRVAELMAVLVAAAALGWWAMRWAAAHALPAERNLAVLAPVTPKASEDFAHFALGATDLLYQRLQKHQTEPGFQVASFVEGMDEHVQSAADAHKVLGVTLTLIPTIEQRADVYRARLSLWNSARASVIATREFEVPIAQPFAFLDRLYRESAALLKLSARHTDAASELGVHGAGTLRFMLQGIGRMRAAATATETERAVEDLELARRTEPEASVLPWLSAAQRKCFTLGNDRRWLDQAVTSARQATARDSMRAEGFRYLGLALLGKKDDAGAVVAFARACSLNPTDDDSHSRLGSALGRTGRWDAEIATYRSVVARRPHCWQPYWWLANAYYRRGQVVESIHAYREMVRHSPDSYRGYSYLGGLLVLGGAYVPAIDTLKRSLDLKPTKTAFDNLGTAYFNSGRIQDAIDAYNQAFQFGFAEYDSWMNLGDAYYFLRGRQDQAAEAYAQAIKLGRERAASRAQQGRAFDVMVPANLSTVFPKIAQPDSASVYLSQALASDSSNVMVQYCAALTCWQLSQPDQAIRWLNQAVLGGYPVAWLRDSPVFREWQTQPGFRAILERSKAEPASSPSPN